MRLHWRDCLETIEHFFYLDESKKFSFGRILSRTITYFADTQLDRDPLRSARDDAACYRADPSPSKTRRRLRAYSKSNDVYSGRLYAKRFALWNRNKLFLTLEIKINGIWHSGANEKERERLETFQRLIYSQIKFSILSWILNDLSVTYLSLSIMFKIVGGAQAIRYLTISLWPCLDARCSAVWPVSSIDRSEYPFWWSCFKVGRLPIFAALSISSQFFSSNSAVNPWTPEFRPKSLSRGLQIETRDPD